MSDNRGFYAPTERKVRMIDRNKFSVMVNQLVMAASFGLETVLARLLLMWFASANYVGVGNASLAFVEGPVYGSDEELDAKHILPIGCGEGRYGVEHPAIAVAEDIGVADRRPLIPLLKAFGKREGSQLRLEVLFRSVRRMRGTDPREIITLTSILLDAIITQGEFNYGQMRGELTLGDIVEQLIKGGHFPEERSRNFMLEQVQKSLDADPVNDVSELSYVVRALFRRLDPEKKGESGEPCPSYTQETIVGWVTTLLSAFYGQQVDYWDAIDEVSHSETLLVPACLGKWRGKLKLVVVESDNDQVRKAAMSPKGSRADIVLYREKTSGRRHIFFNPLTRGLSGETFAKMLEEVEARENKKARVKWAHRGSFDAESGITWWHADKKGNIHNGTPYCPQKVSKLTNDALVAMLMHSFHFVETRSWCKRFGISDSDMPQPNKPTFRSISLVRQDNRPAKPLIVPVLADQAKAGNGIQDALAEVAGKLGLANPAPAPIPDPAATVVEEPVSPVTSKVQKVCKKKCLKKCRQVPERTEGGKPVNGSDRLSAKEEIAEALQEATLTD